MPFYGYLRHGHFEPLCQQKQLDVENPRRQMLGREYLHCGATREEFESTLRVANVAYSDDTQDSVEAVHEDVAEEGSLANI